MLTAFSRLGVRVFVFLFVSIGLAVCGYVVSSSSSRVMVSPDVVISQVYGAGGNAGASFQNDFIELFNRGNSTVNLTGWAVQYASATGTTWSKTDLTGMLAPGKYLLIQQAGGANGSPLPAPDVTGTIAMAATAGKIVLTNTNTLITSGTSCPMGATVVDILGYGTAADCFEGGLPTANLSATTAALRASNGCTESDNNSTDFFVAAPNPRNSATAAIVCGAPTNPTGTGSASPNPVNAGNVVLLTVNVTPGTNPASTGITVSANLSSINGSASQMFFDDGSNGDSTPNDNVFSFQTLVPAMTMPGAKSFSVTIADAQSRNSMTTISLTVQAPAAPGSVVISQVYGGGGNSGATFINDFIELFNRTNAPVNITGWAVQYTSSTGSSWAKTDLTGTIAPGQYFLIQQASGGANGAALPTPDATGTIAMAATAGKIVLTNTNTLIVGGTLCPMDATVVDIVGYGSANCFEGAGAAPAPSATAADLRAMNGCADTNDNSADFTASAPTPRNTASPTAICGAPTNPTGIGSASPNPVTIGNAVLLTVTVTSGTNPASTGLTVTANISSIGGAAAQLFYDNGQNGDVTANDNVFSFQPLVDPMTSPGVKMISVAIADAQSRSGSTTISLTVQAPAPPANVVISQVYGGGGNSGAPFTHDFIELFNRSVALVNLNGWSVQYGSGSGTTWQKTDLTGTIAPGQYLLIQQDSGGANGAALPTPDVIGTITLAATSGKVALVNNANLLSGACPLGPNTIDFVGYGSGVNCVEGAGAAPAPSGTIAILRVGQGCGDTNQNALNFQTGAPAPRNTASPLRDCSGGAAFIPANVLLRITDTAVCAGAGSIVTVEASLKNTGNRAQTDNPGSEFVALLPANLLAVENTCTASGGGCAINGSQIDWNGAVAINETVTIKFNAQVKDGAAQGSQLCVNATVNFDSDNDGINNATVNSQTCLAVNCPAVGPGAALPATAEGSDQKAGSVLVFPFYSSIGTNQTRENTRFNLTNTEPSRSVAVHLFFVQDDEAPVADAYVCLTPNQTTSFLAADLDPDVSGYLIAIAVDARTGCPINFNFLIGDEYVKLMSGHAANLSAVAFTALTGAPPACDGNSVTAELNFDGLSYNAAPRVLALDSILSAADGNSTLLVVDRIGGNLGTGISTVGQLFGILYDDEEHAFSFERSTTRRQFRAVLSNSDFPRTAPRFTNVIPAGRTGWMKFWRDENGGIIGAAINFNPNTAAVGSAFNQGHNLHHLTLTNAARFIVPIFPPNC
ncbi:MAG: lamin tail domain-containing protein [Blastocatellia bacterium]